MFAQQDCKNLIKILTESTTKRAEILETARIAKHFCADKGDISEILGADFLGACV